MSTTEKILQESKPLSSAALKSRSFLENAYKYQIRTAVILSYGDRYRLLVIHEHRLLADRYYTTLKGARIGFLRLYGHKAWKKHDEPEWSSFEPFEEKTDLKTLYRKYQEVTHGQTRRKKSKTATKRF